MKKIMFNEEYGLNNAVLQGEKTNTRRDGHKVYLDYERGRSLGDFPTLTLEEYAIRKSPYKVGDEVAVAQSYKAMGYDPMFCPPGHEDGLGSEAGWSNKLFVSADLCKHHIKITEVRFERLQNISEEDCLREGILQSVDGMDMYTFDGWSKHHKGGVLRVQVYSKDPREAFASLIDRISGKGTWERNPYVYVYSFTLID